MAQALRAGFRRSSIADVQQALLQRQTSVSKLCQESLRLIDETKNLNAFITVCREEALSKAQLMDKQLLLLQQQQQQAPPTTSDHRDTVCQTKGPLTQSRPTPPLPSKLYGVPVSIKDNFCTKQTLTTCGSKMLSNFIPPYTASAVLKLEEAKCLLMGKTNMDEFAMGSSCSTSHYGITANYWKSKISAPGSSAPQPDDWYMAGGSSTGSAVSVASGTCFASLATDTGGSARQPASLNGVVGFKPSYGLVSRFGLIPLAHCMDTVSVIARCVRDVSLVFETIIGQDENDLTSVDHRQVLVHKLKNSCLAADHNKDSKRPIRVGVPSEFIANGDVDEEVASCFDTVVKTLSRIGASGGCQFEIVNLDLPYSRLSTECYTIISSAEIASNMSCYDGIKYGHSTLANQAHEGAAHFDRNALFKANRDSGFNSEVKKRILLGNYFLLEHNRDRYLGQALRVRRQVSNEFQCAFGAPQNIDLVLMPSTPSAATTYREWLHKADNNKLFGEDYFLIPANLASLPSISVPCGFSSSGMPMGVQIVANKFHDRDLLLAAQYLEGHLDGLEPHRS